MTMVEIVTRASCCVNTVLVGPNGTGKTTILDAIHQVSLTATC
jgi:predicted ATP-binding protein involved in virulence